jgi:hypothetical protein
LARGNLKAIDGITSLARGLPHPQHAWIATTVLASPIIETQRDTPREASEFSIAHPALPPTKNYNA